MNAYLIKYRSFNSEDYCEFISAKNEQDARRKARKMVYKRDDRDRIISVEERNDLKNYY